MKGVRTQPFAPPFSGARFLVAVFSLEGDIGPDPARPKAARPPFRKHGAAPMSMRTSGGGSLTPAKPLRHDASNSFLSGGGGLMARLKQADLLDIPALRANCSRRRPSRPTAEPRQGRARLEKLLAEAHAAERMPWDALPVLPLPPHLPADDPVASRGRRAPVPPRLRRRDGARSSPAIAHRSTVLH